MGRKIVAGDLRGFSSQPTVHRAFERRPINGGWVIEIDSGTESDGKMRSIAIKFVEGNCSSERLAENFLNMRRKPAFSCAAAADNRHHQRAGTGGRSRAGAASAHCLTADEELSRTRLNRFSKPSM